MASTRSPDRPIRLTVVLDETAVGGAEVMILEIFRRLDPAAAAPRLVCLRADGPLADEFRASGFAVEVLGRTGRFDMRTLPRLVAVLRRQRTDVVLVVHFHRASLTLGRLAAKLAGAANVIAVRDMDLASVGLRALPRYVVNTLFLSDALMLQAPSQGRYLRELEGVGRFPWSRVPEVVVWNGITVPPRPVPADRAAARALLDLAPDDLVIGIAARLKPQKAHEVLLRAVHRLGDRPNLRVVVIGGGEREAALRTMTDELGLADRVLFTGMRRDVPALLPGLDISCLCSVHEGTPVSVIEAMAACLPVVATDCGAIRDMIDDGVEGYVVPVGDVEAYAERLALLAGDADLRVRLGDRGRARVERDFRIESTIAGFQGMLAGLVGVR